MYILKLNFMVMTKTTTTTTMMMMVVAVVVVMMAVMMTVIRQKYVFFGKKLLIPYQMLVYGLCRNRKNALVTRQRAI